MKKTAIEDWILSSALQSSEIAHAMVDYLDAEDFSEDGQNRELFVAIQETVENDPKYTNTMLGKSISKHVIDSTRIAKLRKMGGVSEDECGALIQLLKEINERRKVALFSRDLSIMASDEHVDMQSIRESLSQAMDLITPPSLRSGNQISVIGDKYRKNLSKPSDTILVGVESLDIGTNGFPKKEMSALVGTAGSGKTSLALAMAYNVARMGKQVAYYCFEMAEEKMYEKILSHHGNIPYFVLERRDPHQIERWKDSIVEKSTELDNMGLQIFDETVTPDLNRLIDSIRYRASKNNVEFVVVDYLQKVPVPQYEREYDRITIASQRLSMVAKECNIALLALVQPNNAYEKRILTEGGLPSLIDIHGSGQISKDAANIIFIMRRRYGKDFAQTGMKHQFHLPFHETELYYLKGRFGEAQQMFGGLAFIPNYSKYVNVSWNENDNHQKMPCPQCGQNFVTFDTGRIKCKGCKLDQPFVDRDAKSGLLFMQRNIEVYGKEFTYDYAFLKNGNYQSDTIAKNIELMNRRIKTLDGEPIKRISFHDGTPLAKLSIGGATEEYYEDI